MRKNTLLKNLRQNQRMENDTKSSHSDSDHSEEESLDEQNENIREIYKKETITWDEMYDVLMLWIEYGDDPFEDEYSELYEIYRNTQNPLLKKNIKTMLKIMDMLRPRCYGYD